MDPLYLLALPVLLFAWLGLVRLLGRGDRDPEGVARDGRDWCGPPSGRHGPSLLSYLWERFIRRRA